MTDQAEHAVICGECLGELHPSQPRDYMGTSQRHKHRSDCLYPLNKHIKDLAAEVERLTGELKGYSGWAPDQFLRYQGEHRKLQKEHCALDARRFELEAEVERLRAENEELKSFIINMQHAYKLDIEACEEELKRLRSQLGSLSTEVGGI